MPGQAGDWGRRSSCIEGVQDGEWLQGSDENGAIEESRSMISLGTRTWCWPEGGEGGLWVPYGKGPAVCGRSQRSYRVIDGPR